MNDLKSGKSTLSTAALSRIAQKEKIAIDFNNIEKIADYKNKAYAYRGEGLEIISTHGTVNDMAHAYINCNWVGILRRHEPEE